MSCESCDVKKENNNNIMCPTRMSDGRAFTDYRPRCIVNAELLNHLSKANMIKSSYESRMFLQKNADQVMEEERQKAINRLIPCAPCKRSFNDPGTMLPERYLIRCDGVTCSREEVNPTGLGDGRQY